MADSALLILTVEAGSLSGRRLISAWTILSNRIVGFGIYLEVIAICEGRYGDLLRVILVSTPLLVKTDASYIAAVLIPIELCPSIRYSGFQ
jgi:hypothetical protein